MHRLSIRPLCIGLPRGMIFAPPVMADNATAAIRTAYARAFRAYMLLLQRRNDLSKKRKDTSLWPADEAAPPAEVESMVAADPAVKTYVFQAQARPPGIRFIRDKFAGKP